MSAPRAAVLFVTGTDTGVGKTRVGATLAAALTRRGHTVRVLKPAETGWPDDAGTAARDTDAALLKRAAADPAPLEVVVPFRFPDPLAPSVAARRAGTEVDVEAIERNVAERRVGADLLLVEGAGGALVPLTDDVTMLDLARRLGGAVLVVAANRLGVINHTLLTVAAVERAGLALLGVVLNEVAPEPPDLARSTNVGVLSDRLGERWLGHLPWAPDPTDDPASVAALERHVCLDAWLGLLL